MMSQQKYLKKLLAEKHHQMRGKMIAGLFEVDGVRFGPLPLQVQGWKCFGSHSGGMEEEFCFFLALAQVLV